MMLRNDTSFNPKRVKLNATSAQVVSFFFLAMSPSNVDPPQAKTPLRFYLVVLPREWTFSFLLDLAAYRCCSSLLLPILQGVGDNDVRRTWLHFLAGSCDVSCISESFRVLDRTVLDGRFYMLVLRHVSGSWHWHMLPKLQFTLGGDVIVEFPMVFPIIFGSSSGIRLNRSLKTSMSKKAHLLPIPSTFIGG